MYGPAGQVAHHHFTLVSISAGNHLHSLTNSCQRYILLSHLLAVFYWLGKLQYFIH